MKVLIYRQKGEIYRINDVQTYLDNGKTIEELEAQMKVFNADEPKYGNTVEMHDVPAGEEEMYNLLMTEGDWLYGDSTKGFVHSCKEWAPSGNYLYVFYKHEGHDTLSISVTKIISSGGSQLPCIHGKKGVLPIAWCYARDLMGVLGLTKREVNKLFKMAKSDAWPWYDKAEEE